MHDDTGWPAVPLSQLADLQAGLLDDELAESVRRRARTELGVARQLSALERVRRKVAELGADPASAPEVPTAVTARVGAALRALPPLTENAAPNELLTSRRPRGTQDPRRTT